MVIFSYASLYIEITFDGSLEGGAGAGDVGGPRTQSSHTPPQSMFCSS